MFVIKLGGELSDVLGVGGAQTYKILTSKKGGLALEMLSKSSGTIAPFHPQLSDVAIDGM